MPELASMSWPAAALLAATVLILAMFGLTLIGHFPVAQRRAEFKTTAGRLLLALSIVVVALVTAKTLGFAIERVPGPVAIISTGAALLAAPVLLQKLPDSFVDGRRGLIVLASMAAALAWVGQRL